MSQLINKIIGFTVSSFSIIHNDVDIFNVGLTLVEKKVSTSHCVKEN